MKQAVICTLSGQGDVDVFLVSPEALSWCENVQPGNRPIPPEVRQSLEPFIRPNDEDALEALNDEVDITSGSAENDAMIHLSCIVQGFSNQRAAVAFAKKNGFELAEEEYEGCIY